MKPKRFLVILLVSLAAMCLLASPALAGQWYEKGSPDYQQGKPNIIQEPRGEYQGPNPYPGPDVIYGYPWIEEPPHWGKTDLEPPYGPP